MFSKPSALFSEAYKEITKSMRLFCTDDVACIENRMTTISDLVVRLNDQDPKGAERLGKDVRAYASGAPPQMARFMSTLHDSVPVKVF